MLVSCLAYCYTVKMETTCAYETYINLHRTTRRYIQDDRTQYFVRQNSVLHEVTYGRGNDNLTIPVTDTEGGGVHQILTSERH
jgi:hypothetical protein